MSGSISASKSNIDSSYQSVTQQSGIKAGDGGFEVNVKGNTDLKGAVIASTQAAIDQNRNTFTTGGTLTTSDIQNSASFEGKSVGISIGAGQSAKTAGIQGVGAGIGSDKGDASSTTTSGISGMAANTAVRSTDAPTGLKPIFDADKVQKEINAQVVITQAFGRDASKAVGDYTQSQRKALQESAKAAATETEAKQIQAQLNELNTQERVMNVLIGAVTGLGGSALTKEGLSAAADQMRQMMIEDSMKFAGITDGTTTLGNLTGPSEGVRGDGQKIGGTRVDLDLLCGADNKRCKTNDDGSLRLNQQSQVVFIPSEAGGKSLEEFLQTPEGQKASGPTGGVQGAKATLFGVPYEPGSWQDKLIESFSGTHDMIGGKLSGLYDAQGNIKRGMSGNERSAYNTWAGVAILPASPFAAAESLPPEVWNAISILMKAAK